MKFEKPGLLAITVALIIGAAVILFLSLGNYYFNFSLSPTAVFGLGALTAVISYLLIFYAVEQFIYNKVKIIYKNIHELKVGNDTDEDEVVRTSDLDYVTREVSEWAEQRRNEIIELRERENFRREFIGNISHELKTPIFNIQGYMLTLLDGALDDPEINRKYLKRANKSVDRMINIIDDLETISALESKSVQLSLSSFDIIELVREVFDVSEDKAAKRNIALTLKKDYDKPIKVEADRPKIEQVLTNLITNAIKYGKNDGKIEVRFYDMHDNVLVEISDDGVGIPQEDIPRVFERFYRVDKSRSREAGGTGLGLSIVKHILEAHKQTINVRSSENAGSTFSFTLKKGK